MDEDRENIMECTADTIIRIDEMQELTETIAFDILNCSDSIQNTIEKLSGYLEVCGIPAEKNQADSVIGDCLDALCNLAESMSAYAHANEEACAQQRENLDELERIMDYSGSCN